jgi:hypothetical protein
VAAGAVLLNYPQVLLRIQQPLFAVSTGTIFNS